MPRWHKSQAVLDAAARWRDRCLQADGSILSDRPLWTPENLAHLDRHFLQNLETGQGSFMSKLQEQLAPAPPAAKQLAAELIWILYLTPSEEALKGATKRLHISRVWNWSGEPLPEAGRELEVLNEGVANPGPGFHNHKWREFGFAIELARDWKRVPAAQRDRLVTDPWAFAAWVDEHPASSGRQFRHMLLYLLFPDHFERVVTSRHKEQIARAFLVRLGGDPDAVNYKSRTAVDRALFELIPQLEQAYVAENLDFYLDPLHRVWAPNDEPVDKAEPGTQPVDDEVAAWYHKKFGNARVWVISAGEGARLWPQLRAANLVGIGWDYLGDLAQYASREEVHEYIQLQEGGNPTNSSLACWQFAHDLRPGDHVLVKQGRKVILAHGVITSGYRFDDARSEYQHVCDVEWQSEGPWTFPRGHGFSTKTLTEVTAYPHTLRTVFSWIEQEAKKGGSPTPVQEPYTRADAEREVFLPAEQLATILDSLARRKNVILEGAPGVGKSFLARRIAWALMGTIDASRVELVQFHQSYAYEDFVQGWRPEKGGGFELREGAFYRFCRRAEKDPDRNYVFIIDEINRGNLSKVLGELMLLIEPDKRGPEFAIPLTYSRTADERFHVPRNVYVLGMMNTADRSLAMVDYALRRRFVFIRLEPAFESEGFANALTEAGVPEALLGRIVERMTALNAAIRADTQNLGPGYEIGHSFFVPDAEGDEPGEGWYEDVIRYEIAPLLREYWPDQPRRAEEHIARLLAP